MSNEIENVSFECEHCEGIITLGIEGGIDSLNGDMPPSCLYCGAIGTLKHKPDAEPAKDVVFDRRNHE